MKHYLRSILLFILAIGCVLWFSLPLWGQPAPTPISALRLYPRQLKATLDRGNISGAVHLLEQGWKTNFDEYYQRSIKAQLVPPSQIAQSLTQTARLTGKRSALIYAISIPDQLEVILLLPNGRLIHHRQTAATPEAVKKTTDNFRMGLVDVNSRPDEYLPAAQQLYQWLIAPLKSELQNQKIDNLIFCLGKGLRSAPMAALHDGSKFLIETYGISVIPAFNLLDRRPSDLSEGRVLAMGASEFQQESPLPAVPLELGAIARIWETEVRLNEQFTVAQLQEQRSIYPFGIVHLATHATFESGSVENSYIQFWDRPLRLNQLQQLKLQPAVELLVLSACRTAVGDASAELGFAGLAIQSGAKAALASLWHISDATTIVAMINFYENLKTAPIKVEALRQTQLALLQNRLRLESPSIQQTIRGIEVPESVQEAIGDDLSHPYYWAGFTMIGNPW